MTDLRSRLTELLAHAVVAIAPERAEMPIELDRPKQPEHGDFASNVALQHAKALRRNPREFAQALVAALPKSDLVAKIEIAGAGFINIFVTPAARQAVVKDILVEGERFGRSESRRGERVMVEFVSANPTGPLHVGHGRQAALGDALARLIEWQGAAVSREFYYNDAGQQIENLAVSVRVRAQQLLGEHASLPEDGYHGDYIRELAQRYLDEVGHDLGDIDSIRRFAVAELRLEQDRDLTAFGVRFDNYFLESSLYPTGAWTRRSSGWSHPARRTRRRRAVAQDDRIRRRQGSRDEEVGWRVHVFRARHRVPRDEVGARIHHRHQHPGLRPPRHDDARARGTAGGRPRHPGGLSVYVIHKMVTVMKGGEEVKISKRAGSFRVAARPDRRSRPRCGPLLPGGAQGRERIHVRHRSRAVADARQSCVLRAVRERARRIGDAAGGTSRRTRGCGCATPISRR
jgi:arginyl-tRNA synthetase